MKGHLIKAASSLFGESIVRLCLAGIGAGVLVLLGGVAMGQAGASLAALASSWLFFTGIAAGGVAVSAAMRVTHAGWGKHIVPVAEAAAAFLPASFGILVVLMAAAKAWMPALQHEDALTWIFLAARVLASMVLLLWAARRYLTSVRASGAPGGATATRHAIVYLVLYVAGLTLWAIDLVMGLSSFAPSTVVPPLYFVGAFLSAVAWATLVTSVRVLRGASLPSDSDRTDLAKVLFGFSVFWFYLVWSGFLPVWYANMPEETGQLLARWEGGYKPLSIAVVTSVFFVPFWVLMPGSAKRRPARVAFGAALILVGLAGERFLLVLPSLPVQGAWVVIAGVGATALLLGVFLITAGAELVETRA